MAFSVGILGLPNVGKSTLFNAMTNAGAESANYPFCTIEPNMGMALVYDKRLDQINQFFDTEKIIPAGIQIIDIAGLVEGASKGEGLGNKFLGNVRSCTALMHVVRCFEDEGVTHVRGDIDPLLDVKTIEAELVLSDLENLEKREQRLSKAAKSGDKEARKELEFLKKMLSHLEDEKLAHSYPVDEDQKEYIREWGLLSAKPILFVANLGEDESKNTDEAKMEALKAYAAESDSKLTTIQASLEAEIAQIEEEEEKLEFLEAMNLEEPGLHRLSRELYNLLGYQSYFTAGKKEVRAWTIKIGQTAPEAAGAIHTDFQKGFIRAEVFTLADLLEHKSEVNLKKAGLVRSEGKEYIVKDGDIVHFLFNV